MKRKPTTLPWQAVEVNDKIEIQDSGPISLTLVATTPTRDDNHRGYKKRKANAELIIRSVNCAPDLADALHDLVWCIRDGQMGDYSPLMDEIFDAEAALKDFGTKMKKPRSEKEWERRRALGFCR